MNWHDGLRESQKQYALALLRNDTFSAFTHANYMRIFQHLLDDEMNVSARVTVQAKNYIKGFDASLPQRN